MTFETWRLGIGDYNCDLTGMEWTRRWRLSGWELETRLESWRLWNGSDNGNLAPGEWRREWCLSGGKVAMTLET